MDRLVNGIDVAAVKQQLREYGAYCVCAFLPAPAPSAQKWGLLSTLCKALTASRPAPGCLVRRTPPNPLCPPSLPPPVLLGHSVPDDLVVGFLKNLQLDADEAPGGR